MIGNAGRVGAFGEKAVEAELLRRNWIPANVNASVKNSADFDIFAKKGAHSVHLRVKTCGPGLRAFQFGGFKPEIEISCRGFLKTDFTVLVSMGNDRDSDCFYVIPTKIVRMRLARYRNAYLNTGKRNGEKRKDIGHWTLHLAPLRNGEKRFNYGLEKHWNIYLDNWASLEGL